MYSTWLASLSVQWYASCDYTGAVSVLRLPRRHPTDAEALGNRRSADGIVGQNYTSKLLLFVW